MNAATLIQLHPPPTMAFRVHLEKGISGLFLLMLETMVPKTRNDRRNNNKSNMWTSGPREKTTYRKQKSKQENTAARPQVGFSLPHFITVTCFNPWTALKRDPRKEKHYI